MVRVEDIREGVILTTPSGEYLVIKINEYDEFGHFFKYMLVDRHTFNNEGWFRDEEDILRHEKVLEVKSAIIDDVR